METEGRTDHPELYRSVLADQVVTGDMYPFRGLCPGRVHEISSKKERSSLCEFQKRRRMLALFLTVLTQVSALFFMMLIGWGLAKLGRLDRIGLDQITTLLLYVMTPCVVINCMQVDASEEVYRALLTAGFWSIVIYAGQAVFARFLFRKKEPKKRAALQMGSVYGNIVFMGLPLIQMVLGDSAVIYLTASMIFQILFIWTHGVTVISGHTSVKNALLNPAIPSFIVGMFFLTTGLRLPTAIDSSVRLLAGVNSPLAMIVIGAQMAAADIGKVFRNRELYGVALVKLLILPALVGILLYPFHSPFLVYCMLVIMSATPTAGNVSIFAQRFGGDEESAVQAVFLTTVLSLVTLPLVSTIVQFMVSR